MGKKKGLSLELAAYNKARAIVLEHPTPDGPPRPGWLGEDFVEYEARPPGKSVPVCSGLDCPWWESAYLRNARAVLAGKELTGARGCGKTSAELDPGDICWPEVT